ncbi:MAG: hypothetical protein KKG33_06865 [candidate division Zixibacteria bacterium]|nr:hypothetical protein [candidate division Zixibacteria bacterium]MBU1470630.1 hypothetical protein [candidate division Zixibacteria bacterium]MBU2625264.1 hypothetical protein [candidate division Zixibacteria bacterium]
MPKRFACAYIPDFPLEIIFREKPSLSSKPVALTVECSGQERIIELSDRAARAGVRRYIQKLWIE